MVTIQRLPVLRSTSSVTYMGCNYIYLPQYQQWFSWRNGLLIWSIYIKSWWRHQNGTFSALLAFCAGIHRSPVNSEFPEFSALLQRRLKESKWKYYIFQIIWFDVFSSRLLLFLQHNCNLTAKSGKRVGFKNLSVMLNELASRQNY